MSINAFLESIATQAIIRDNERERIDYSIQTIIKKLKNYFRSMQIIIDEPLVFGSYKRKTIIPRKFDPESDVDIMVIFGKRSENFLFRSQQYKPQTYLNYLKNFAEAHYPRSESYRDFPTVAIELNHIKFELVPAIYDPIEYYKIPDKPIWGYYHLQDWINTNPNDLDQALVNNQTLRRLVRLAKVWNAKADYVYASYELEKWITQQIFWGNLEEHFFKFCELLPISWDLSETKKDKIKNLKDLASIVKVSRRWEYLNGIFG